MRILCLLLIILWPFSIWAAPLTVPRQDDNGLVDLQDWVATETGIVVLMRTSPFREQSANQPHLYAVSWRYDATAAVVVRLYRDDAPPIARLAADGRSAIVAIQTDALEYRYERISIADGDQLNHWDAPTPGHLRSSAAGLLEVLASTRAGKKTPATIRWRFLTDNGAAGAERDWTGGVGQRLLLGSFPGAHNDAGIVALTSMTEDAGLALGDNEPLTIPAASGTRTLIPKLMNETRAALVDTTGLKWESPPLARSFLWGGDAGTGGDIPMSQLAAQLEKEQQATTAWEVRRGGHQELLTSSYAEREPLVRARPDGGVVALVTAQSALGARTEDQRGVHLLQTSSASQWDEAARIEPAVRALGLQFSDLMAMGAGKATTFGRVRESHRTAGVHVTVFDASGRVLRYARLPADVEPVALVGKAAIGVTNISDQQSAQSLWLASLTDFADRRVPDLSAAKPTRRQPNKAPKAERATRADVKARQTGSQCACTCQEHDELTDLQERLQTTPPSEMAKVMSELAPAMGRMACMGTCFTEYQACEQAKP